eukprot:gnl/MRDRNA2_/MRDRNA2_92916_c0_seq1.p1 gnl/MRDRNA2_/MRDRNA2_92916_c0~~gnl/MRDRNA2_/MRDRNA2_92916_c0_seq1.p1  ORF type:complete len:957 (+),score=281.74 gnl/MRDRNA2_/MRDRNA2_92916_c0_seq1:158-3028(+)
MFRARGPKTSGGLLAELALDQVKSKDGSRKLACMMRLFRGELRVYGPHDTNIDGRPEETISLMNAPGSKPLLGIEKTSPSGFQLRVACGGTGGTYTASERLLKFDAQRAEDADAFFRSVETEWERVYPLTPSKIAKRNTRSLSPARIAKHEGKKFTKESAFDDRRMMHTMASLNSILSDTIPAVNVGPRTNKLFCLKLRTFLVWACENGGVAALGEGEIGPTDRPPLRCDHIHIDRFHEKLCVACEPSTSGDARILAVAAQVYYDLAGYAKDSTPRAQDLLQRLALGALLMSVAECGATLRSLSLWLAATGKWGRLCSICEEPLGLTPREALALTALSAPTPKDFRGLCKRLQSFTRTQIGSTIPLRMWSERTIRAAVVVFAPQPLKKQKPDDKGQGDAAKDGENKDSEKKDSEKNDSEKKKSEKKADEEDKKSENPFFLAEASETGTQLRRRLIFDEALLDPRDKGAASKLQVCITRLSDLAEENTLSKEEKEKEKTEKEKKKFKERLEERTSSQLRCTRACLRHLLPNVKVKIAPGKSATDWVKAEDREEKKEGKDDEGKDKDKKDKDTEEKDEEGKDKDKKADEDKNKTNKEKDNKDKTEKEKDKPESVSEIKATSINIEDMVEWVVEFLTDAKKNKEKSTDTGVTQGRMGLLFAEAVPVCADSPTVVASLTEAVRKASIAKEDDASNDTEDEKEDEKSKENEEKAKEDLAETEEQKAKKKKKEERKKMKEQQAKESKQTLANPPPWILFEFHETQAHVFQLRVFWMPHEEKSAGKENRRVSKTGIEAAEEWKSFVVPLERFAELAPNLWEEHADAARKQREEEEAKKKEEQEAAKKKKEEEEAKKKAETIRPSQLGPAPGGGPVRGSFRPGAPGGAAPPRGSFRPGAPGGGVGGAEAKKAPVRGSFRPGTPGGGVGGTEKKETRASVRPGAMTGQASDGAKKSVRGSVRPGA